MSGYENVLSSHMSLHPLRVSLGVVWLRRWIREAGGATVLPQTGLRTPRLPRLPRSWPRSASLSRWIHLVGWSLLYGRCKAHAVGGVLGGVSVVIVAELGGAVHQAAVPGIVRRRGQGRVWSGLLALRGPGVGVELGVGGVGDPGGRTWVVAASSGAWNSAGRHWSTGRCLWAAGGGAGRTAAGVRGSELSLVMDLARLGPGLFVGGGSDVVVAIGWVLGSERTLSFLFFLEFLGIYYIFTLRDRSVFCKNNRSWYSLE